MNLDERGLRGNVIWDHWRSQYSEGSGHERFATVLEPDALAETLEPPDISTLFPRRKSKKWL